MSSALGHKTHYSASTLVSNNWFEERAIQELNSQRSVADGACQRLIETGEPERFKNATTNAGLSNGDLFGHGPDKEALHRRRLRSEYQHRMTPPSSSELDPAGFTESRPASSWSSSNTSWSSETLSTDSSSSSLGSTSPLQRSPKLHRHSSTIELPVVTSNMGSKRAAQITKLQNGVFQARHLQLRGGEKSSSLPASKMNRST
ncbi:hypothetical protein PROFUN_01920 [Planoprotostelium fungivorum]|uniref:Uncharacterized protein n=1 Tax=Planoprotostelium fungivorum TaxID=1890364 RepID=A0A2P6NZ26_9EUKA|nr:hypothetical protein PROFUN_01920 [Planoprotostelium fungivorum]